MVNTALTGWYSARVGKILCLWWFSSVVFSLLLLQPFEPYFKAQAQTPATSAYDPLVLLVMLQRERSLLSAALGSGAVWLIVCKLCAQLPLTLVLVALAKPKLGPGATFVRSLQRLPKVALLSLLSEGLTLLWLYLGAMYWARFSWLDVTWNQLLTAAAFGVLSGVGLLMCLTLLDAARVAETRASRRRALYDVLALGLSVVRHAPVRVGLESLLFRVAGFCSLGVTLASAVAVACAQHPWAPYLAWLVAQCGAWVNLWLRVAWYARATRHFKVYAHPTATTEHNDVPLAPSPNLDA
jgi:hypothetical protein